MPNFASTQTRCIMIVVIILLFYVAYRSYNKFKGGGAKGEAEEEEEGGFIEKTKVKDGSKVAGNNDVDYDKINRIVEDIMRKQI